MSPEEKSLSHFWQAMASIQFYLQWQKFAASRTVFGKLCKSESSSSFISFQLHSIRTSLGPDHKSLVPRNTLAWLWLNKSVVTNQIRECQNCPIRFNVSYSINFTRLELISVLSRFPLLVNGILLFILTLKQCLEWCIHRRSISIHSDYIIRDVIVYAARWLYCVAPDPCGLEHLWARHTHCSN